MRTADDHPLAIAEGGMNGIDRCHRALNRLSAPNYFWDDRCRDTAFESIGEAIADDELGEVIELRPLHELSTIWILIEPSGYSVHASRKAAVAARAERARQVKEQ